MFYKTPRINSYPKAHFVEPKEKSWVLFPQRGKVLYFCHKLSCNDPNEVNSISTKNRLLEIQLA